MRTSTSTRSIRRWPAIPKTGVPPTRALTNLKGVRTKIFAAPKAKPDILYIGLNDRDRAAGTTCTSCTFRPARRRCCARTPSRSPAGTSITTATCALAERTNQAGDTEILRVDADGFKQIYSCTVLEACGVRGFDAANKQVYLVTNKGALNLSELELMDPATGATTKVESDPENRVDIGSVQDVGGRSPHSFHRVRGRPYRRYFKDKAFETGLPLAAVEAARQGDRSSARRSKDENIWIVSAYSDIEPGETYVWNRKAQDARPAVPDSRGAAARIAVRSASPTTSSRRTGSTFLPT